MSVFQDIILYEHLADAFIACLLSAITCGIVGSYVVARRMVFLSGGITHASFGGLGLAIYTGLNPLIGALLFASVASVGVEFASRQGHIREDSAIGIIWSIGMALGALFMSLTPGYAVELPSYLFGSISLVDGNDIQWLLLLMLVVVIGALLWGRKIMYVTFDEEYARSQGLPVGMIAYIMAIVVAVTIVLSIKVMGIVLLMSLVTIPCVVANTITKDYRKITLLAVIIALVCNITGFVMSYEIELPNGGGIPTGSCIIFLLSMALLLAKLFDIVRRRVAKSAPRA
ncbi:MAG: metal ABC transporter permease [Alistipes sp.]|nr:metal ABC transporter permease [Alistipes sp.]